MGWIDDLTSAPTKMLCTVSGHDFRRIGDFLVCDFCGYRIEVKRRP